MIFDRIIVKIKNIEPITNTNKPSNSFSSEYSKKKEPSTIMGFVTYIRSSESFFEVPSDITPAFAAAIPVIIIINKIIT
jgi:hypothetical protein